MNIGELNKLNKEQLINLFRQLELTQRLIKIDLDANSQWVKSYCKSELRDVKRDVSKLKREKKILNARVYKLYSILKLYNKWR